MARTQAGFVRVAVFGKNKDESGAAARGTGNLKMTVPRKRGGEVKTVGDRKVPGGFKEACDAASIPPTLRQLSKWNRKRGKAFTEGRKLAKENAA